MPGRRDAQRRDHRRKTQCLSSPGDKIVRFTLFHQDENAGMDDKRLDFRVSVMKLSVAGAHKVAVSTVKPQRAEGAEHRRFSAPLS